MIGLASNGHVIRLYECPLTWITEETGELLRMLRLVKDTSVPPLAGGWADQPAWFVEAFDIYTREIADWQKEQAQKRKKHGE